MMEKKITRTLVRAEACVTLYNREQKVIDEENIVLINPGKDILADARAQLETENLSVLDIKLVRVVRTRYSMELSDFMKHAIVVEDEVSAVDDATEEAMA